MGVSSRQGSIALAIQTAKGSPAATPTVKFFLAASPSLAPVKERARFQMTDDSRDQGGAYTSRLAVEGDFQVYAHPQGLALLTAACLGANVDADLGGGNYKHTATPADDMLWVTIWRMTAGGQIVERFVDCKINTLQVEGSSGQPMTVTVGVLGINSEWVGSDTVLAALTDQPYIYPELCGRILVDEAVERIHSISFGINNGASSYQADCYVPFDIDPGGREISLSYSTRFGGAIAAADYQTFYYGSASGTSLHPAVGTHAFSFELYRDADTRFKVELPRLVYAAVPVQSDPGGAPIEVEVATEVEKPSSGDIVTCTTWDQVAEVYSA